MTFLHRAQLITALNVNLKSRRSINSTICRTPSQPTSKPARNALRKQDYPNVNHWERRQNDTTQFSVINVYDTDDSSDTDGNSLDDNDLGITKRECGVLAFLEDEDGKVIGCHERKRLYAELRGFWNDNINPDHPPDNWSSAGATLRDKFRDTLEEKFPFLRFCAGRWKVEALWKKNYHSWKRSLLARQARRAPLNIRASGYDNGSKRKRNKSPELVDSNSENEILFDGPQMKKAKTSTVPISTTTRSQKVCQLIEAGFLIATKGCPDSEDRGEAGGTFRRECFRHCCHRTSITAFQPSTQLKNATLNSKVRLVLFRPCHLALQTWTAN